MSINSFAKRIEITIDQVHCPTYSSLMQVAIRDCYPEPICYRPYAEDIWFDVNLDGKMLSMNFRNGTKYVFDSFDIDDRKEELAFLRAGSYDIPNQSFNLCCKYKMFPGSGTVTLTWAVNERVFENDSSQFYQQLRDEFNLWVTQLNEALAANDTAKVEALKPLIIDALKTIQAQEAGHGVSGKTPVPDAINY